MNRRSLLIGAALVTVAGAGTALGVVAGGHGEAAGSQPNAGLPPATTPVTTRTLTDYTEVDGTLGYGDRVDLTARGAGTVTWLPAAGAVIERGGPLYKLDELPITLLYGTLPAYRPLTTGTEGADVRQFEENLAALGYPGFTVDDVYTGKTADAVRDWQQDLGREQTGTVEPAEIVYAGGPVRVSELVARPGDQPGGPLLRYTGTSRAVTVDLDVDDQRLAVAGAPVTVTLPGGATVEGTIASVGTAVSAPESSQGGGDSQPSTIEVAVTVADQAALGALDQAPVKVKLVASKRENVLTVPVAALLALREGGYGVEVVEGPASNGTQSSGTPSSGTQTSRIVAVEVGMFAGGRVEITGAGITDGMLVGVPS
jgi:peptidoglycan hydrolase-like protein with peptidoglycan-binding domain